MHTRLSVLARLAAVGLATAALLAACFAFSPTARAQENADKFQRSFTVNTGSTLRVENYKGTIHVTGTSSNQIIVNVVKKFDGGESERKWWMENVKINFSNDANHAAVEVRYPNFNCFFCWETHDYSAAVELEIQVPKHTNVDLDGYKPDIRVTSLDGDIRIKSYKAPMTLDSTSGAIRIETYKDNIHLKNVTVRHGLDVRSFKADIQVEARGMEGSSTVESDKGNIVVRLPGNTGLDVDYTGGRRASFHSEFALATQAAGRFRSDVRGTINQGGALLRLRTERGSVSLEKLSGTL